MVSEIRVTQANPGPDVIDFGIGQPGNDLLPLDIMRRAAEIRLGSGDANLLNYGYELGDGYFRLELARFLSWHYGQLVSDNNLMVTCGVSQALDLICTCFTKPGDTVFVEEPTYFLALRIFADHNLRVVNVPSGKNGLDMDALRSLLKTQQPAFLYTIPTFQNPSGATLPAGGRRQLLDLSEEFGFHIVADEVYQLLNYEMDPPPVLASFSDSEQVLSLGSFSKILAPGLRLGWIHAAPLLLQKLAGSGLVDSGGGLNPFTSGIVGVVLERGWQADYLKRLKRIYKHRIEVMDAALQRHLVGAGRFGKPAGGFFFWVGLPEELDSAELLAVARERGVGYQPGGKFSGSGGLRNFLRLSFAYYGEEKIGEGIMRLGEVLCDVVG